MHLADHGVLGDAELAPDLAGAQAPRPQRAQAIELLSGPLGAEPASQAQQLAPALALHGQLPSAVSAGFDPRCPAIAASAPDGACGATRDTSPAAGDTRPSPTRSPAAPIVPVPAPSWSECP